MLSSGSFPHTLALLVLVALVILGVLFLVAAVGRRFRAMTASLNNSELRFKVLAETSENGIFTCDEGFDYVNPAMGKITGYSEGELYQMPVVDLLGFAPQAELSDANERGPLHRETFITTKHNRHRWLYVTLGRLPGEGDHRYLGSVFDITERKQMEQELRYLAFNDPLTDLPNRKFFMNRLNALLTEEAFVPLPAASLHPTPPSTQEALVPTVVPSFALMFVDVNRFRLINDHFGLSKGDSLLRMIAQRIKSVLPQATLVARVGGDEFAVLLQANPAGVGAAAATQAQEANQIVLVERDAQRLHKAFESAFQLGEQEFFLSLSVGIAFYHESYTEAEQVYRDATLAKEIAKRRGQTQPTCVFDSHMHAAAQGRLQLENDMRQALQDGSFELYYQPIVTLPEGRLRGFEALIRWRRGDTMVLPGDFIALAEETGLINPLGDWILHEACQQIGKWNGLGEDAQDFYVSVNLSSIQFFQAGLIDTVRRALTDHGVKPGQLKLELTESMLVDDNPQVIERMRQLQSMGCAIMVDDFGTGYSSLSYLQRFPLGVLKIDQSFVAKINQSTGLHLVSAIIAMARALELGVIAEGIESAEIAEQLAALGCDVGQGYHFARPLTAQAATDFFPRESSATQTALF